MKVPQYDRWSQELWNAYLLKLSGKTYIYDNWKYNQQEEHRLNTKNTSFYHKERFNRFRAHQNDMKLISEYTTLSETRRRRSLNAKMGNQFYVIGTYIDIKV
jgi:hypothetical protein